MAGKLIDEPQDLVLGVDTTFMDTKQKLTTGSPDTTEPQNGAMYKGKKYQDHCFAEYYSTKHDATLTKRISNWREQQIMSKALQTLEPFDSVLDLPSGAGRFLPILARFEARVIASDISVEMLKQGMQHDGLYQRRPIRFVTSADRVCMPTDAVDVVFCARLIQHLPASKTRVSVLSELGRVARKGLVLSFFDSKTYKHRRRMHKQRRNGKIRHRYAMTRQELIAEAQQAGLTLVKMYALLPGFAEVTAAAFRAG
ncbi:MAG: class I SAM-dependent methyltransferase [Planctomycetota bacterium]|jgi:ubiquinone/menaquinone biosynthesis C-methylase UbiE